MNGDQFAFRFFIVLKLGSTVQLRISFEVAF